VFVGNPPTPPELADLYGEAYWEDPEAPGYAGYRSREESKRHHFAGLLRRMDGFARDKGLLLEVGCAYGYFLDEARKSGWGVVGVEPSPPAARFAREELDLNVTSGGLEDVEVEEGSLGAVVLWDVIEHLPEPRRTLKRAYDLLAPGGILAVSTGDIHSLSARIHGRQWSLLTPPWHLFFFSRSTLRRLVEGEGFTVLRVDGDGLVGADPHSPQPRLPGLLTRILESGPATRVGRFLRRGMIMFLYAQKPRVP
jgi:SAM-dependent methyltransferase